MEALHDRQADEVPPDSWDRLVRVTHWGLAVVVLANGLLNEGGGIWHVSLGWLGMGLLAARLLWGLIGPEEARFAAFPLRPRRALAHLRDLLRGRPRAYRSHNPAGAVMVYTLWLLIAVTIGTGLLLTHGATPFEIARQKAAVEAGDWSALAGASRSEGAGADPGGTSWRGRLGDVHATTANLMLVLVVLHVAGVAAEGFALRRNLLRPMIHAGNRVDTAGRTDDRGRT